VQSIDILTKEITFSESISTTNNSNANLSFANDNRVVFTGISTTQETNGDLTLNATAYIQYFGWDDVTFTFDLDNILVIPDPVGSVTTTTAVINGDVATSGGENLNANGGVIEEKFLIVYDATDDTTIQIDCECGGGTADYSINFDLISGHQYEYYAIIQSRGGTFATGASKTYTHP